MQECEVFYYYYYYCRVLCDVENAIAILQLRLCEAMGDDLGDEWWAGGEDLGMFT